MLKTIVVILIALWLAGFILKIGGGLIHLLLLIAVAVFIYDMLMGKRRA